MCGPPPGNCNWNIKGVGKEILRKICGPPPGNGYWSIKGVGKENLEKNMWATTGKRVLEHKRHGKGKS
jgi:hypothetical protein